MQIARILAGFSLAEADVLRKAIGKKIKDLLVAQREKFTQGCQKNNVSESIAKKVFEWIEPHASYSFNKSHAAAYAMIAYQTAFLKAHYPLEFMSSLLTAEKGDVERIAFLIQECKEMGIEVLAPDINESYRHFSVVAGADQIRFGLLAIKNVGHNVVEAIVQERKIGGPFKTIEDFISRLPAKEVNKRSLESLIKAGCFDKMTERKQLLVNLEKLLDFNRESNKNKDNGQQGLFDSTGYNTAALVLQKTSPASKQDLLQWEKELLGLFVSSHPLDGFKQIFSQRAIELVKISEVFLNKRVRVGGIISQIKRIVARNGKPMLFLNLEDQTDRKEIVVFPNVLEANPAVFQENKIVLISGRVDVRDGSPKIIADQVEEIIEKE
jgi:DNA polymerase-3 subunit alpha